MNGQKKYSAKDIERYRSGQLSAAEMHALEKAALDDPFLADALEGYAFTQTPSADLATLQEKLQSRLQKDRKRGAFFPSQTWLRAAALFVLIAGSGWLVVSLFSDRKASVVATREVQKQAASPDPADRADSQTVFSDAPSVTPPVQTAGASGQSRPQEQPVDQRNKEAQTGTTASAAAPAPLIPLSADSAKDRVYAARELAEKEEGRRREGYLASPNVSLAEKTQAQAQAPATGDTIRNFDITLKRTDVAADEVVVLSKKAKEVSQARRMTAVIDSLEPAEGWTNFDDYVANNLKEPAELKTKNVRGEVELSFEVNKEGEPVNIRVVRSLCDACDAEAVRLLKEGPKWKQNQKKGKIKIKFPR